MTLVVHPLNSLPIDVPSWTCKVLNKMEAFLGDAP
jgi:hypothetical protein